MIRVNREALWNVLIYGIEEGLLRATTSFYRNNRACVRLGEGESNWF